MRELFVLLAHLLTPMFKLCRPGGLYTVVAESLAVNAERSPSRLPIPSGSQSTRMGCIDDYDRQRTKEAQERIERAGNAGVPPPILISCLVDQEANPELNRKETWLLAEIEAF